ncbi:MarR family winged helix-turn-helix transcriptional regulator [Pseudacidovorax intermedius]|uniref:DNA-binding MarR family transcriptional regulator n=1 Tax=Pseudacidovorax intermedius TaxID=433924 RepID=A0A370FFJ1_9BURK|nr:MarR family transcriptional regulator [Pseudacidovorax intermedius]RDI24352.1 DNA-binding MarR family transcriptional regulator [Pseudacidovorax intermedius]
MSEGSAASAAEKRRLEALSEFRYRLRNFLRFSEDAAREEGITVLHYQLLLHTQGFAGRDWATVTEIAERLQAQVHGVVALISRCEEAGLVQRKPGRTDRRQTEVHLLPKGQRKLQKLAGQHLGQISALAEAVRLAQAIAGPAEAGGAPASEAAEAS